MENFIYKKEKKIFKSIPVLGIYSGILKGVDDCGVMRAT